MRWIFILLFVPGLTGCGLSLLGARVGGNISPSMDWQPYDSDAALEQAFLQSTISCNSGETCPEHVGALFTISENEEGRRGLGSCSMSLIAPNRILTNGHCVPSQINTQSSESECSQVMRLYFPGQLGRQAESFRCRRIVATSGDPVDGESASPDWAIIEFSGISGRSPAAMNFGGIESHQPLTIHKVNFNHLRGFNNRGIIQSIRCLGNTNYLLSDNYLGAISPVINVSDCSDKVLKGNSGSGIVNESGELVAVFSFGALVEEGYDINSIRIRQRFPGIRQNSGGGTNLACIVALNPSPLSPLCHFENHDHYSRLTTVYSATVQQQLNTESYEEAMAEWRNGLSSEAAAHFQWADQAEEWLGLVDMEISQGSEKQTRHVLDLALKTQYPYFPKCVEPQAADSLEFDILALRFDLWDVAERTFRATRPTISQTVRVRFSKQEGGYYSTTWGVDADAGSAMGLLRESSLENLSITGLAIKVPVCESLSQ